jgi:cytochrome P450
MTIGLHPPGPKSLLPGAHLLALRRDPIGFLTRLAREYGDIAHFKIGPQDLFLLNHPDYVKDILVVNHRQFMKGRGLQHAKKLLGEGLLTSEGEFHRRQRRLAQPAFHRQRITSYGATMVAYAARTRERWQPGQTLDVAQEMGTLALAIAGKTLFDTDVTSESSEIREALGAAMKLFNILTLPFADLLEKLPLPSTRRFHKAKERLDGTIYRMINERRASGEDRGDLLSMLILAQDLEGDGGRMTDEQLRDEAMTIFLAGHETTANALAWTWYLVARHPEVEAKLHAEIDAVLAGRLPTADDVPRLRYTEMVFAEAMRLYPPAWVMGRRALEDYEVESYLIPAGSILLFSQYLMHHDERFFPDPFRFDPERFTPEAQGLRPKFTYFPFGGGPRVCIGESFAWMEGVLVMATLAQAWRMRLAPDHPVEPQPLITLRPKNGVWVKLEPR